MATVTTTKDDFNLGEHFIKALQVKGTFDEEGHLFASTLRHAKRVCVDKCLHMEATALSHKEKMCLGRCTDAMNHMSMSSFMNFTAALSLKELSRVHDAKVTEAKNN
jgi:hypothetical protein